MARTRIKICGVKSLEVARAAIDAGADAVGFMFVRSSVRFVEPEEADAIMRALPPLVTTVGVFANAPLDLFCDIEEVCPTNLVQLHGTEDEALVKQCGPGLIRAIKFDAATIGRELARWDAIEEVSAIMVDGSVGGQGQAFDWAGLAAVASGVSKPIFLAGGLTPENVAGAIRAVRPYAVDVSSGVERERGVKDPALIEAFCRAVQGADGG